MNTRNLSNSGFGFQPSDEPCESLGLIPVQSGKEVGGTGFQHAAAKAGEV